MTQTADSRKPRSTGAVARAFGVTHATVKEWIRLGHLRAFRTPGGHWRVPAAELERVRAAHDGLAAGEPLRLLVVDDDERVAGLLVDTLRSRATGAKVEAAADGYEGILKVGTFRPHVLLLDVRMPGLDGFEVCRRVKASPDLAETGVILISGYVDESTDAQVRACGADEFLAKPIRLPDLVRAVERVLGVRRPRSGAR